MCTVQITSAKDCQKLHQIFDEMKDEVNAGIIEPWAMSEKAFYEEALKRFAVKMNVDDDFFETLANKLRELWPPGEKDGKYPWRDSVPNLVHRLEFLWKERNFKDKYTLDDCLMAARRYLAQFETNVKYMQVLKYFIFKQNKLVATDGKITYTYKSSFGDLLESNPTNTTSDEWSELFESSNTYDQGELI